MFTIRVITSTFTIQSTFFIRMLDYHATLQIYLLIYLRFIHAPMIDKKPIA